MKVDYRVLPTDPDYPLMRGNTPFAREFNRRMKALRMDNKFDPDRIFEQTTVIIMEILVEEYDRKNGKKRTIPAKKAAKEE